MQGKKPHVLEVAGLPAVHVWKGVLQVTGQAVDDLDAPAMDPLALHHVPPDATIQLHQFGIDSQRRVLPGLGDLALELDQPVSVTFG